MRIFNNSMYVYHILIEFRNIYKTCSVYLYIEDMKTLNESLELITVHNPFI